MWTDWTIVDEWYSWLAMTTLYTFVCFIRKVNYKYVIKYAVENKCQLEISNMWNSIAFALISYKCPVPLEAHTSAV